MRAKEFIIEYKQDQTINAYGNKLVQKATSNREPDNITKIISALEAMDPTKNKQYVIWLVRQYLAGKFRLEDQQRILDDLTTYNQLKPRLPVEQRDINKLSYSALVDVIDQVQNINLNTPDVTSNATTPESGTFPVVPGSKVLYNGPYGQLAIPETEEASKELGRGTRWCTSANKNNMFSQYNDDGPLYVWRDRDGSKYQFHFESGQFMDSKDRPISDKELDYFRNKNPITSKLFAQKEKEIIDSSNAERAYVYAINVLKSRWPEAEPFIAKDPRTVGEYAKNVLKSRWPEAEPFIAKDPGTASAYAINVLKSRWPEAEPVIAKDSKSAYLYVRNVLQGRWPEAEPFIAKNPGTASDYARYVLDYKRFIEAEPFIAKDPRYAYYYAKDILKSRFIEAEPFIAKDPEQAYLYARNVLKSRWPEAEPSIAKNPVYANLYASDILQGQPWSKEN